MSENSGKQISGFRLIRGEWIFTGFLLFFCALFTFVEWNNGKLWTNDFRVYYDATRDFFAGNNPYVHSYGLSTGYFKYPPFTLYLFSPAVIIPYWLAQFIHLTLLAFSLIVSMITIRQLTDRFLSDSVKRMPVGMLYLTFLAVAIHLVRELHMGNVNLMLLILFCLGLRSFLNNKPFQIAIFWSVMLILKPIMILVVLPLVLHQGWKIIIWMAAFGVFFLLFPVLHVGLNGNVALWKDWFKAISAHGDYLTSFNSIGTMVKMATGFSASWAVALFCLLGLLLLMLRDRLKSGTSLQQVLIWSVVLAAFVPNFFVTDTEHFLLSLPLIYLLLNALRENGRWYHIVIFCLAMLCFSFDSTDLLGKELSDIVYNYGFLGIGNLLFIIDFLLLRFQRSNGVSMEK